MPKKVGFNTSAILDKVYPIVEKAISSRHKAWMHVISSFIQKRSSSLFDTAPCDRIYYTDFDREELFNALGLGPHEIENGIRDTYYYSIAAFKPSQAKDSTTIVCLCIVRYFFLKQMQKELDLAMVYLAFSGKFYPSIHYGFFRTVAPAKYRHIMDYVVSYKLNNKFDLKQKGNIIATIKSINETWVTAYKKEMKQFDDEEVCYVIQQLHNRIKSFIKNIAALYYEAYENKEYISYDKDSLPEEGDSSLYHLTTNDSFKLQMYVENTMTKINTSQIDYAICKNCSDANVKTEEIKSIIESILNDKHNLLLVREYITLTIAAFLEESPVKEINSAKFLTFAIKPKPNTKNPAILRSKEIMDQLLDDNSVGFRKRKHRNATRQSYYSAFSTYFAIVAIRANT